MNSIKVELAGLIKRIDNFLAKWSSINNQVKVEITLIFIFIFTSEWVIKAFKIWVFGNFHKTGAIDLNL
jgi:hypothetical protein